MKSNLPPDFARKWSEFKPKLITTIENIELYTPEQKKTLKSNISSIYADFDRGLSSKLNQAAKEGDPVKLKKMLWEIVKITTQYYAVVEARSASWDEGANTVKKVFQMQLGTLREAAQLTCRAL